MLKFDGAAKKPTNLTLNSKVLEAAKELGMNISQTVDALLAEEVRKRYWEKWQAENKDAIQAYNDRVARDGIWGAKHRTFGKSSGDGRKED